MWSRYFGATKPWLRGNKSQIGKTRCLGALLPSYMIANQWVISCLSTDAILTFEFAMEKSLSQDISRVSAQWPYNAKVMAAVHNSQNPTILQNIGCNVFTINFIKPLPSRRNKRGYCGDLPVSSQLTMQTLKWVISSKWNCDEIDNLNKRLAMHQVLHWFQSHHCWTHIWW